MNPKSTVLILWASRTGKTQLVCERIAEVLQKAGQNVDSQRVRDFTGDPRDYSALVAASPTYGSGDLHADWDQLERLWRDFDFVGLAAAVVGCGSSRYPQPFGAVDILETRLGNQGARLLLPSLRVNTLSGLRVRDGDPWAEELAEILATRSH